MGIKNSDEKLITNFSGLKVCWFITSLFTYALMKTKKVETSRILETELSLLCFDLIGLYVLCIYTRYL